MYTDEAGNHRQRVRPGETFAKPKSWRTTYVLSEDPERVATVRWIFETYTEQDVGVRYLALKLNERGIRSPTGKQWRSGSIRTILRNPAYCGMVAYGRTSRGKYFRSSAGEIKACNGSGTFEQINREEWITKEDAHEAIVTPAVFQAAQEKLYARRDRSTPSVAQDNYLLSGLVYCAHCGQRMQGQRRHKQIKKKTYVWFHYVCPSYAHEGAKNAAGCGYHTVPQEAIAEFVIQRLLDVLYCGGNRERLRELILQRLSGLEIPTGRTGSPSGQAGRPGPGTEDGNAADASSAGGHCRPLGRRTGEYPQGPRPDRPGPRSVPADGNARRYRSVR